MIYLYVEHLLNIRALSIQASLSTVSNQETKASLSADGNILTLTHEGETASVQLPVNISPNQQSLVSLTIPAVPSKDLSFRIQVEEKPDSNLLGDGNRENGNIVPWTADSLTNETEVCCRHCSSVLVRRGTIQTWKDLPSEGWAEMMEFWHCHKPHESHSYGNGEVNRGFGADSKLAVNTGVGLVDVVDFLFVPEDCQNVVVGFQPSYALPLYSCFNVLRSIRAKKNRRSRAARHSYGKVAGIQRAQDQARLMQMPASTSRKRW